MNRLFLTLLLLSLVQVSAVAQLKPVVPAVLVKPTSSTTPSTAANPPTSVVTAAGAMEAPQATVAASPKIYKASSFGIKSDGKVMNTRSIQKAIDFISQNGGGELQFFVGRYLTGSIHLKSNVVIRLNEGAILVGSVNPYDYDVVLGNQGLILGQDQEHVAIVGKGVIDGRGFELAQNLVQQIHLGYVKDELKYDRPGVRPKLVYLRSCTDVLFEGITLTNSGDWTLTCDQCVDLEIQGITVNSKNYWNNDGLDIVDCRHVLVQNSFIDASDDAICLKSHDPAACCEDVLVRDCVARSSASGIKFGTASRGGFKNVRILNNKVYDTHRSAITIECVDGGEVENILVDSLYAVNTSNAIFLRTGKRQAGDVTGYMRDITLSNIYVEVPATKADAGYPYEGPVEDLPRNISPASVVGIPQMPIENVRLHHITIVYPGGGDPMYAFRGTTPEALDGIPEMIDAYPEFSQFKELPAWAFYMRHVRGISLQNVHCQALKADYRPALVLDDVLDGAFSDVTFDIPQKTDHPQVVTYRSRVTGL